MTKGLFFVIGCVTGLFIGYYHFCPAVPKGHGCDAAVKGCEVTAANVEKQLEECFYSRHLLASLLEDCIDSPEHCAQKVRDFVASQTN